MRCQHQNKYHHEQKARDNIDKMLERFGWKVVDQNAIDWSIRLGLAVSILQRKKTR
jgi:hypothetical protein